MKLGDILIAQGVISFNQRSAAIRRHMATGGVLGKTLINLGMITQQQLKVGLREQKRMRRLKLGGLNPAQPDARR